MDKKKLTSEERKMTENKVEELKILNVMYWMKIEKPGR